MTEVYFSYFWVEGQDQSISMASFWWESLSRDLTVVPLPVGGAREYCEVPFIVFLTIKKIKV